jgi:hypothetical protein
MEYLKLPRKQKKVILGHTLPKYKLRAKLNLIKSGKPITEFFCPTCGCTSFSGTGNLTSYPEHWERFNCSRCETLVGYIDNSVFIHALECADNNWDPSF